MEPNNLNLILAASSYGPIFTLSLWYASTAIWRPRNSSTVITTIISKPLLYMLPCVVTVAAVLCLLIAATVTWVRNREEIATCWILWTCRLLILAYSTILANIILFTKSSLWINISCLDQPGGRLVFFSSLISQFGLAIFGIAQLLFLEKAESRTTQSPAYLYAVPLPAYVGLAVIVLYLVIEMDTKGPYTYRWRLLSLFMTSWMVLALCVTWIGIALGTGAVANVLILHTISCNAWLLIEVENVLFRDPVVGTWWKWFTKSKDPSLAPTTVLQRKDEEYGLGPTSTALVSQASPTTTDLSQPKIGSVQIPRPTASTEALVDYGSLSTRTDSIIQRKD